MTGCDRCRTELGAYVVGGLAIDEVDGVEMHLEGCSACRHERDELAETVPLLELARTPAARAPARVRDRIIAQAARRRARRRWTAAAAAASIVAALLGGMLGWVLRGPQETLVVPLRQAEDVEAVGWATLHHVDTRLVVELAVEGLEPLPAPAVYEAWLATEDERVLSIGQLPAAEDGTITAALVADEPLDAYRSVWITAEPDRRDPAHEGPTVLSAPLPRPR